jgi:hypothetical protein
MTLIFVFCFLEPEDGGNESYRHCKRVHLEGRQTYVISPLLLEVKYIYFPINNVKTVLKCSLSWALFFLSKLV